MAVVRHLFLDLEDTIITPVVEGWGNSALINVDVIRATIERFNPEFVHLFSFAIWDQAQLDAFNRRTRKHIEDALGIQFSLCPRVDEDIIPACCQVLGLHHDRVDFGDASAFWSKHEGFRLFVRNEFKTLKNHEGTEVEVMLLDDAVINETFEWPDLKIKGHILNIDSLSEAFHAINRSNRA